MTHNKLTVVLLTYNCGHRLDPILDRLLGLGLPIVAVDNASVDDTVEVLQARAGVSVIRSTDNIGAAARNLGVAAARTPYVVCCDDDGWYERDGLDAAVRLLDRHDRLAVVNARILVGENADLDGISAEMAASPLADRHGVPGPVLLSFMGGAAIVRVSAWHQVGGYDPEFFIGGEEETLAIKLVRHGWALRYVPEVVMHHEPSIANAPGLRAHGLRNTLWNCWLHRPWRSAVRYTALVLADTPKNSDWMRGIAMTLAGLPWVLRRRSPVDAAIDADLRVLEDRRFAQRRPWWNRVDPVRSMQPTHPAPLRTPTAGALSPARSRPAARPSARADR